MDYYITRFVFQKALALVYLIAFLVVLHQFRPLLGEKGLLPVPKFVKVVPFFESPSIFFFLPKDFWFFVFGLIGTILSFFALTGFSERFGIVVSMATWALLWLIYLSFVNVGQTFYAFGWESMLLETGFLAIFLGDAHTRVPVIIIWLLRWVLFRDMFGAGLIKLRGDMCWKNLTCLNYHYETQPIPNPLSWYFHWMPEWTHKAGVLFNHFAELIVPFFYFVPLAILSGIAGLITIIFQAMLMLSGNFSFLNFLTIVLAISTFSDTILIKIIPITAQPGLAPSWYTVSVWIVTILIGILSIQPLFNLISPYQIMNTNFEPLHLVNTYGAFGSITKERFEIILEGTDDKVITEKTRWKEYEFIGKPGELKRMPGQIAPYHLRLDWLMWFAAMYPNAQDPWFFALVEKLLENDKPTLSLLAKNPFPNHAPFFVRALLYKYQFTTPEEKNKTGNWWKRQYMNVYLPAVSQFSSK